MRKCPKEGYPLPIFDIFWMESGGKGGIGTAGISSAQTTLLLIFFCFISFVFLVLSLGFSWMDLVLL